MLHGGDYMAKKRAARDIMKVPVITVKGDMLVTDVIKLMTRWSISAIPVIDDDRKLLGMVTGRLIMNFPIDGVAARTVVSEVMTKQMENCCPTYAPETPDEKIMNDFAASRINRALVVDDGKVVGIISRLDIIGELDRIYSRYVAGAEA